MAECAGDLLRRLGVVPQVGDTRLLAQIGDLRLELLDTDHGPDVIESAAQRCDLVRKVDLDHVGSSLPAGATA